jgi:glycyl-tRNA synthetase beta chain
MNAKPAKPKARAIATTDLLVEIGCEELPPKSLATLGRAFHAGVVKALLDEAGLRLEDTRAEAFWSPRRLAVRITGLRAKQDARRIERLGPALAAAFDAEGKPTKAAEGFARSCNTTVAALERQDGKLCYRSTQPGKALDVLAPEAVRAALAALPTPKRMRWGAGDAEFVRPVHWVVLLVGGAVVKAEILGVTAGRDSRGHRHHHPGAVRIAAPAQYAATLRRAKVWLDGDGCDLREEIVRQVSAQAKKAGGTAPGLARDSALVAEVAALCEWPVALRGGFDPKFLELPPEVLTLTLERHQRYFPLHRGADRATQLLPEFVFVANIVSKQPAIVVAGNERVIVPRLSDAMFFWAQDRAQPLAARAAGLAQMAFQKALGSYADKSARVGALAESIAALTGADIALTRQAAALAKCDLLTSMVGEFPELQGTVGRHLAQHERLPAEVASALEEQYFPRHAGDALPQTKVGQALALADRLDTICGLFTIGQKPTGDKDPFALRRAALGALRIMIECRLDLDLKGLIAEALPLSKATDNALHAELYGFFMDRLRAYYADAGHRADVFAAVMARAPARPLDFDARLKAVEAFLTLPEAAALASANKRSANILRQAGGAAGAGVDAALLREPGERALHAALASPQIAAARSALDEGDYALALRQLAGLRGPVDQFFDGVMVMAEDPALKANRLALLAQLQALFLHTADLAQLQAEA